MPFPTPPASHHRPVLLLGRVLATPGAVKALVEAQCDGGTLLDRHARGDWGELDADDRTKNDAALVAGDRAYGAWRDGGLTLHDISDPRAPKLLSHINWSPPFPGGTHTALPLPGRNLAVARVPLPPSSTFHAAIQLIFPLIKDGENFTVVVETNNPETYVYGSVIENETNIAKFVQPTVGAQRAVAE